MNFSKTITTLDLNLFVEKTMTVTLLDGTKVNVKRPTKEILIMIQALNNVENKDETVRQVVLTAFNNNIEKVPVDISEWPDYMIAGAFNGYIQFLNDLMQNPN